MGEQTKSAWYIETGIPIPPHPKGRKYHFLDTMQIGSNVLLPTEEDAYKIRDAMRYRKMKWSLRKTREGWRVWYTGDEDE